MNASWGIDSISLSESSRSCSWPRLEKGAPWRELMLFPAKSLENWVADMREGGSGRRINRIIRVKFCGYKAMRRT